VEDREGELVSEYAVKIGQYITPVVFKGLGIVGQPAPHYYFHRPISLLLKQCFQAGFYLDGFEEPAFDQPGEPDRPSSWENFREIPPAMVARMRLPSLH
jgi:hypothetical protein